MFHERHQRTIAKSITWRIIAFSSSLIILYIITGSWETSFYQSLIIHSVKTILYYIHERLWNTSNFGQELRKGQIN